MDERDETRRLRQIADQMENRSVIDFASAKTAIDEALRYIEEQQSQIAFAAEQSARLKNEVSHTVIDANNGNLRGCQERLRIILNELKKGTP